MGTTLINDIAIDGIKYRAELGISTNQDALDLLEYIEKNVVSEAFAVRVETAVDEAIRNVTLDSDEIISAIIQKLKSK